VTLTANETPSINDITARELVPLIRRVAEFDPATRAAVEEGRLRAVSSGSDLPVIDLTKISPAAATAAAGADLIVLEGMGRAIETNLNARFTVDVLKLGMVKHPEVATCLGGTLYDCVCKFG
jgi:type II pantothenate kinase